MAHRVFLFSILFYAILEAVPNFAVWDQASRVVESTPDAKLPPIFAASDPVRMKHIDYQILSYPIWPTPALKGTTYLEMELRAINRGKDTFAFCAVPGRPMLKRADGKGLEARFHGGNHPMWPKMILIEPGRAALAKHFAWLYRGEEGLSLAWYEGGKYAWSYDGLQVGKYLLHLNHEVLDSKGNMTGSVLSKAASIEIRELKASREIIAGQTAMQALTDGSWLTPAPGKQNLIALGLRLTNVRGPSWARIIPSISKVTMTSSDGTVKVSKKTEAVVPRPEPEPYHLQPDISQTYAEVAMLSTNGQFLRLTWVDSTGNVWQVEGLRPGKYSIRYEVQGHDGKTIQRRTTWTDALRTIIQSPRDWDQEWTTWTGAAQTAAVEVEIR